MFNCFFFLCSFTAAQILRHIHSLGFLDNFTESYIENLTKRNGFCFFRELVAFLHEKCLESSSFAWRSSMVFAALGQFEVAGIKFRDVLLRRIQVGTVQKPLKIVYVKTIQQLWKNDNVETIQQLLRNVNSKCKQCFKIDG